jgi:hypothetical protein
MTTATRSAIAQIATDRALGRDARISTFSLDDLAVHLERWGLSPSMSFFSIENGMIHLHWCCHGEDITEEMRTAECMDIRMSTDRDGQDVPLLEFTDITEYGVIHPAAMYELRYIADYALK